MALHTLPVLRWAGLAAVTLLAGCALVPLPEAPPVQQSRWLEQNWPAAERHWYHHASQGTSTFPVPYAWFVALEQPTLNLFGAPKRLVEPDYMRRFGFIPSPAGLSDASAARSHGYAAAVDAAQTSTTLARYGMTPAELNPDRLPVGFARTPGYVDPASGQKLPDQVGLSCAACHTGHIEYRGTSLLIDGGPAVTNLDALRHALVYAMAYTYYLPSRFNRFADRVLGAQHSEADRSTLRQRLKATIDRIKTIRDAEEAAPGQDVSEGFNRLDALNRIGNAVFAESMFGADPKLLGFEPISNYAHISAPVKYPHIWDSAWFDWVQYDASIMQPMVRNAGEAMGVYAHVNLTNPQRPLYASSIPLRNLHDMERLLAGPNPTARQPAGFAGLHAPRWPAELFGAVDAQQAATGRQLYGELCQGCHLPPPAEAAFWDGRHWTQPNAAGERYLKVTRANVGTDPAQYEVLRQRTIRVPAFLNLPAIEETAPGSGIYCRTGSATVTQGPFATVLGAVVQRTVEQGYRDQGIPPAEQPDLDGHRPNCLQAPAAYKARPLDGIWAAAPYLHNGSVPTLDDLLRPVAERPARFCLGLREYDPAKVGFRTECASGTFELDTSLAGNRNTGHEFSAAWRPGADNPPGVIGRALSDSERAALIAYLKTL